MDIRINQISGLRNNHIRVHFNADLESFDDGAINLGGNLSDEDFAKYIDLEGLEKEIKGKLSEKIMNGEEIDAE